MTAQKEDLANADMEDYVEAIKERPVRQRPLTAPRNRAEPDPRFITFRKKDSLGTTGNQRSFAKLALDKELARSNRKAELSYMWKQESALKRLESAYLNQDFAWQKYHAPAITMPFDLSTKIEEKPAAKVEVAKKPVKRNLYNNFMSSQLLYGAPLK